MHNPYFQGIPIDSSQSFSLKSFERFTSDTWTVKYHFHELCELVVYENITGTFYNDGRANPIEKGQVLLIPPESIHSFDVQPGKLIYHVFHFSPQYILSLTELGKLPKQATLVRISNTDLEMVLALIKWLNVNINNNRISQQTQQGFRLLVDTLWPEILHKDQRSKARPMNTFEPLVRYLNNSKKFSVDLSTAADICHLSKSHFMAKFKRTYGITFNDFLLERKISTAKHLLGNTNKSISEISALLEMSNPAYFASRFKEMVGISPREYRKLKR